MAHILLIAVVAISCAYLFPRPKDQGKLKQIGQVIEKRAAGEWEELPDDLMGLPLVDMVNRLKQTWHEVKERAGYIIAVEEIAAVVTLLL